MWVNNKWVRDEIQFRCQTCGNLFKVHRCYLKYGTATYCSKKCYLKFGENNPKWRGGKIKRDGYTYIYTPKHPFATKAGYVCEHRLVMEKQIGRYLVEGEIVHHINGKRDDNSSDNLIIMLDSKHKSHHNKGRKQTPEHIAKRFQNRKPTDCSQRHRNNLGQFV